MIQIIPHLLTNTLMIPMSASCSTRPGYKSRTPAPNSVRSSPLLNPCSSSQKVESSPRPCRLWFCEASPSVAWFFWTANMSRRTFFYRQTRRQLRSFCIASRLQPRLGGSRQNSSSAANLLSRTCHRNGGRSWSRFTTSPLVHNGKTAFTNICSFRIAPKPARAKPIHPAQCFRIWRLCYMPSATMAAMKISFFVNKMIHSYPLI